MDKQEMRALIREAVRDADLRLDEIPSIDLYLDQIISLTSEKRKEGSPRFFERELTKTMINNYSKDGLISPVKGKKYSKEQIVQMLLVYELKNTLSIGEIKRILQNVYAASSPDDGMLQGVYSRFLDIKESEREGVCALVETFVADHSLRPENDADFFAMLLGLASLSSYLKNAVQALLEAHYPDLSAEKEKEEQAKREQAKRQKEEKKANAKAKKSESQTKKESEASE